MKVTARFKDGVITVDGRVVPETFTAEDMEFLRGGHLNVSAWNVRLLKEHHVTHVILGSHPEVDLETFLAAVARTDARIGN